jgi:hypothetical protein
LAKAILELSGLKLPATLVMPVSIYLMNSSKKEESPNVNVVVDTPLEKIPLGVHIEKQIRALEHLGLEVTSSKMDSMSEVYILVGRSIGGEEQIHKVTRAGNLYYTVIGTVWLHTAPEVREDIRQIINSFTLLE